MSELIRLVHMNSSHLLLAEADTDKLTDAQLIGAKGEPKPPNDTRALLRTGALFYCTAHPQLPYVIYFRRHYYINPAAKGLTRKAP